MRLKIFYNHWAMKELAREFRVAARGVAALAVFSKVFGDGWLTYAAAAVIWLILEGVAFAIESVVFSLDPEEKDDERNHNKR
jgi:hypothetical protein